MGPQRCRRPACPRPAPTGRHPHFVLRVGGAQAARELLRFSRPQEPAAASASRGRSSGPGPSPAADPAPPAPAHRAPRRREAAWPSFPRRSAERWASRGAVRGRQAAPPRRPSAQRPRASGTLKRQARRHPPPSFPGRSAGLRFPAAASSRQEASLTPGALLSAHAPDPPLPACGAPGPPPRLQSGPGAARTKAPPPAATPPRSRTKAPPRPPVTPDGGHTHSCRDPRPGTHARLASALLPVPTSGFSVAYLRLRLIFCEAHTLHSPCALHGAENGMSISSATPHGNLCGSCVCPVKGIQHGGTSGGAAQPVTLELLLSDVGGRTY